MQDNNYFSKFNQICRLLYVFGAAIATAIVLSLLSLYYYNPTGEYLAKNVLLNSEVISKLDGKAKNLFTFRGIEYSYYDRTNQQWIKKSVPVETYDTFYKKVASDRSVAVLTDEIKAVFGNGNPSVLSVNVRVDKIESHNPSLAFTDVVFAENGDYYKVMLREASKGEGWAYFYHPGIYETAQQFFVTP